MSEAVRALLIHHQVGAFTGLKTLLEARGIEVSTAQNCGEALLRLWSACPPHLVFTNTWLPDGTWADVLSLARDSLLPVDVIVVSRPVDIGLSIEVLERGAFDFIVPPFEASELDHVIRGAFCHALNQRDLQRAGGGPPSAPTLIESTRKVGRPALLGDQPEEQIPPNL